MASPPQVNGSLESNTSLTSFLRSGWPRAFSSAVLPMKSVAVRREAFRPVQQHLYFGGFQTGCAMNCIGHQDFNLIPVFTQQFKAKGG